MDQKTIMFSHTWAAHSELAVRTNIVLCYNSAICCHSDSPVSQWVTFLKNALSRQASGQQGALAPFWVCQGRRQSSIMHSRKNLGSQMESDRIDCVFLRFCCRMRSSNLKLEEVLCSFYFLLGPATFTLLEECSSQVSCSLSMKCVSRLMLRWDPLSSWDTLEDSVSKHFIKTSSMCWLHSSQCFCCSIFSTFSRIDIF